MRHNLIKYALLSVDLLSLLASFWLAYLFRYEAGLFEAASGRPPFMMYWVAIFLALGFWIILYQVMQLDRIRPGLDFSLGVSELAIAVTLLLVALLAGSYLAKIYYSRLLLLLLSFLMVVLLFAGRTLVRSLLKWGHRYGVGLRRVVIVGQSDLAGEIAQRIRQHPELNYELAGFLAPVAGRNPEAVKGCAFKRSEETARELVQRSVDELLFAMPVRRESEVLDFIAHCQKLGIRVSLVPEYYELHTSQIRSFSLDGIPVFELTDTSLAPPYRLVKVVTDYLLGILLLMLFSPALALISAILYVGTRGVLRPEIRVGLNGVSFTMYRFDLGVVDQWSSAGKAPWAVRFGRFIQRYSLSELPQLINVLKGEMSIVGPRPETPERVRHYSAWHRRRLELKPGITGLAQVRGLRGIDPSDLKTKYDLEYAANLTPLADLTLILATLGTLLKRKPLRPGVTGELPMGESAQAKPR